MFLSTVLESEGGTDGADDDRIIVGGVFGGG